MPRRFCVNLKTFNFQRVFNKFVVRWFFWHVCHQPVSFLEECAEFHLLG